MDLNKFLREEIICEIRYDSILSYFDKRVKICSALLKKLPHWTIGPIKIELFDEKNKDTSSKNYFLFTSHNAAISSKRVEVYTNFEAITKYLLSNITHELGIEKLGRIGVRVRSLYECKQSFENLRDLLVDKLLITSEIKKPDFIPEITDVAYILNFKKETYNFHMEIGPLSKGEIIQKFPFEEKSPFETGLLIDIDCSKENYDGSIENFLKQSYNRIEDISKQFISLLEKGNK